MDRVHTHRVHYVCVLYTGSKQNSVCRQKSDSIQKTLAIDINAGFPDEGS